MALDVKEVQKPVRKLRKLLKKLSKQPDPARVHDLRTNSRRLEAMLSSLSLDSRRPERRLLKNIGRVRKKAGGVRDMDVLISYVPAVKTDDEQQCRVQLIEHLGEQRRKQAKRLRAAVSRKGRQTQAALKKVRQHLKKALCENQDSDCNATEASSKALASALELESELRRPPRLTRQNLHPYRLKVKRLQNVLRLAEESDDQDFVRALGAVKDKIGEWHDWEELLGIAKDVLDHTNCKLIRDLRITAEQRYESALAEAQKMRKKYLSASRSGFLQRPATPTWKATTAMAA